ncbi:MAG: molecular chaperone TorD family protein [Gemmatimonadota bacterium]|nr:molecular chaperone TorD family protein [Gemmatimonadota bacterium]
MEVYRALGLLIEAPTVEHGAVAAALDLPPPPEPAIHGNEVAFQRYPYASVYLGEEGKLGGEARARIAGFWHALGLEAPDEPDHISALLSLATGLTKAEHAETDPARGALLKEARSALLWEHVHSWCVPYLESFRTSPSAYYRAWGDLVRRVIRQELSEGPYPLHLPQALNAAGELTLVDPRKGDSGAGFVPELLAPVRSGLVVLRSDLADLADALNLAMRAGERAYALSSFLAQDPGKTLEWLAGFASRWAARLEEGDAGRQDPVVAWWVRRARSTAALLGALAQDAEVRPPAGRA